MGVILPFILLDLDELGLDTSDSNRELALLVVISPVTVSEINILKGSTRLGTLGLPSLSWLKTNQLQSTALDSDDGGVLVVVLNLVSDGLGDNIGRALALAELALHDQVGLTASRAHLSLINGVHGDDIRVDLAALGALDLEVPGVVGIGGDQLGDVLELSFDLKGEDGHGGNRR